VPDYRLGKHRGKYALIYGSGADRKRIALGTDDRGAAEAVARNIWRKLNAAPSDRVADLWASYVTDRKANVARKDRFESLWKALSPHFGHRLGSAVTRQDCKDYHAARKREGKSPSTIRTELEFLRACLRQRYGKDTPQLWMPPASKPRERFLTREEAQTLLDSIEAPHVRLFVTLAIATGARMSALLDLTWDRVDLEHATADLNPSGRETTNKRRTIVKLNSRALAALAEAKEAALTDHVIEYAGEPVKSIKKAIRAAAKRSGVQCSPHVFRHTAGVWMANADVPMEKIAQALATTVRIAEKHYARYSPSYLKDAAAATDW
jgi:integrase